MLKIKKININWSLCFSFFALLASSITAFYQCNQSQKIEAINYSVNQLQFNPKLSVIDTPFVKNFSIDIPAGFVRPSPILLVKGRMFLDTSVVKFVTSGLKDKRISLIFNSKIAFDSVMAIMKKRESGDTLAIPMVSLKIKLKTVLKIKNIGNSLAKIIFYSVADTNSGSPIIRKDFIKMVNGEKTKHKFHFDYMKEYFQNEILQNNSINIPIEYQISNINEKNKINLHFFFLYENELGNIYDTYYWVVYENFPDLIKPVYSYDKNSKGLKVKFQLKTEAKHMLHVSDIKESYYSYKEEFKEKFKIWLNEYSPPKKKKKK